MQELVIKYLSIIEAGLKLLDLLIFPFVIPAALLLKVVRILGVNRLPLCKKMLLSIGIFPIRNHYYEPQFDYRSLSSPLSQDRCLPGINWNLDKQLHYLTSFSYSQELENLPDKPTKELEYYLNNRKFDAGDSEYWYQVIRHFKPQKIFEIGSGFSTLMAIKAIKANKLEDPNYQCQHICIEPYEMPWLESTGVEVIRERVEDMDVKFFTELGEKDILFIDSSHMIRPQGDVLHEYLEILPILNKGVIVHIHDIFSPKNYPSQWLENQVKFWNEQYLLEAFLSENQSWEIIGALNYLKHHHYEQLKSVTPNLESYNEPGSFYIMKTV